jgi:hypothetical protein
MSLNKVSIDYSRETDDGLLVFGQSVYDALNPNTNFTWEPTVMPAFQSDVDEYRRLLILVINGTSADVLKKNLSRNKLLSTLRSVATVVNIQANGDIVKLQSSGLRLVKPRTKVGILPKPTGFEVRSGDNSGSLFCSVNAHPNSKVYQFYSAKVPAPANITDWRQFTSPNHKATITGYVPGCQYELKSAYQGSDKELVYSDSIFVYAQ